MTDIEQHVDKEHLKVIFYTCGLCNKNFQHKPTFDSHMKTHKDEEKNDRLVKSSSSKVEIKSQIDEKL